MKNAYQSRIRSLKKQVLGHQKAMVRLNQEMFDMLLTDPAKYNRRIAREKDVCRRNLLREDRDRKGAAMRAEADRPLILGPDDFKAQAYYAIWRPASGYPQGIRVMRKWPQVEQHTNTGGRVLYFKTVKSAQRRADSLNSKGGAV